MDKRLFLISIFFFLWCMVSFSQTTEEEYLYVTYGYKEQLLKGLDDKKGYHWEVLTEYKFKEESSGLPLIGSKAIAPGKFEFEGLHREGEDAPCAIVAIYKEKQNMEKRDGLFIPIPHPKSDQEVLVRGKNYYTKDVKFKSEVQTQYILALQKLAMHLAAEAEKP